MAQLGEVGGAHITVRGSVLRPHPEHTAIVAVIGRITVAFVKDEKDDNDQVEQARIPERIPDEMLAVLRVNTPRHLPRLAE